MTAAFTYTNLQLYRLYVRRVMAVSAAVFALSAFMYGAFLLTAVERTAGRASAEESIQNLTVELASLQSRYLAETRNLTPERAQELGLITPSQSTTLFAEAQAPTLSLRHDR